MKLIRNVIDGGFEIINPNVCFISGGSTNSSGGSSQQATSGFQALSPQIQGVFNNLAQQAGGYLNGGNGINSMFTPLAQTAGETSAINTINNNVAPTAANVNANMALQQNPWDSSVIANLNKQANGQQSNLNQAVSAAGQFGSNRAMLGANDIDMSRLNNIGAFQQGEFNTQMNNALTTIPQQQLAQAQAALSAGGFQRNLNAQTQQAPITGLQSIAQILGILPTNSGQSTGTSNNSSSGFNFGIG